MVMLSSVKRAAEGQAMRCCCFCLQAHFTYLIANNTSVCAHLSLCGQFALYSPFGWYFYDLVRSKVTLKRSLSQQHINHLAAEKPYAV